MLCYCRLIHDRELTLFDGTRLLSQDKYVSIKEENQLSDEDMKNRWVKVAICNICHASIQ